VRVDSARVQVRVESARVDSVPVPVPVPVLARGQARLILGLLYPSLPVHSGLARVHSGRPVQSAGHPVCAAVRMRAALAAHPVSGCLSGFVEP